MATGKVARRTAVGDVGELLDSPEVAALIDEIAASGDARGAQGLRCPRTRRRLPCQSSLCSPHLDAGSGPGQGASWLAGRPWRLSEPVGLLPLRGQTQSQPAPFERLP